MYKKLVQMNNIRKIHFFLNVHKMADYVTFASQRCSSLFKRSFTKNHRTRLRYTKIPDLIPTLEMTAEIMYLGRQDIDMLF